MMIMGGDLYYLEPLFHAMDIKTDVTFRCIIIRIIPGSTKTIGEQSKGRRSSFLNEIWHVRQTQSQTARFQTGS
jgi:hypothetical protein